jgi:hypothetical protein
LATKNTPGLCCTKSEQAKLNGFDYVTARTITYAAIQVTFYFLWAFKKKDFFCIIVCLFETNLNDDWVKDTIL